MNNGRGERQDQDPEAGAHIADAGDLTIDQAGNIIKGPDYGPTSQNPTDMQPPTQPAHVSFDPSSLRGYSIFALNTRPEPVPAPQPMPSQEIAAWSNTSTSATDVTEIFPPGVGDDFNQQPPYEGGGGNYDGHLLDDDQPRPEQPKRGGRRAAATLAAVAALAITFGIAGKDVLTSGDEHHPVVQSDGKVVESATPTPTGTSTTPPADNKGGIPLPGLADPTQSATSTAKAHESKSDQGNGSVLQLTEKTTKAKSHTRTASPPKPTDIPVVPLWSPTLTPSAETTTPTPSHSPTEAPSPTNSPSASETPSPSSSTTTAETVPTTTLELEPNHRAIHQLRTQINQEERRQFSQYINPWNIEQQIDRDGITATTIQDFQSNWGYTYNADVFGQPTTLTDDEKPDIKGLINGPQNILWHANDTETAGFVELSSLDITSVAEIQAKISDGEDLSFPSAIEASLLDMTQVPLLDGAEGTTVTAFTRYPNDAYDTVGHIEYFMVIPIDASNQGAVLVRIGETILHNEEQPTEVTPTPEPSWPTPEDSPTTFEAPNPTATFTAQPLSSDAKATKPHHQRQEKYNQDGKRTHHHSQHSEPGDWSKSLHDWFNAIHNRF